MSRAPMGDAPSIWSIPEESRGTILHASHAAHRGAVADHLRRVLGWGEAVTLLTPTPDRAIRIVERFGDRTEVIYSEEK